jgi:hypothetical protein
MGKNLKLTRWTVGVSISYWQVDQKYTNISVVLFIELWSDYRNFNVVPYQRLSLKAAERWRQGPFHMSFRDVYTRSHEIVVDAIHRGAVVVYRDLHTYS